jgi:hypothetical protein
VTAAHLDYDTLAELAEGLLSDAQAASADAHLAGCAECQDRSAEIADVSRLLADAPAPPMPAGLASRIDDALAAAAAASGPVVSLEARRHKRRFRILSVAAAAAFVVGAGALAGQTLLGNSLSSESGTAQSPPLQDRSASARPPAGPGALSGAAGGYRIVRSGTDYTAAGLGGQVSAQLDQAETQAEGSGRAASPGQAVAACVRRVAQGNRPLLVDIARYEGRPATVIVLPATSGRLDIWVVGPGCSASDTALIARTQTTS